MTKKRRPYFNHFVALASFMGAGLSLYLYYKFNKEVQTYVLFTTTLAYVLWGILHHKLAHYLTMGIIFEYILVAALGSLVVFSLLIY